MTQGSSKKSYAGPKTDNPARVAMRDVVALAILIAVALMLMSRSGSRRGTELMPWPDGLEYAAQAVNLDSGRGPVLHFGGYSYPSRYTEGYPLILGAAFPLVGHVVARLYTVNIAFGLLAVAAIYLLTLKLFGRLSAIIAALFLTFSPIFITYSTLALSDVPTMAVTIAAALVLTKCTELEAKPARPTLYASWAIFGLISGFSAMMRPTNAAIVGAVAIALLLTLPNDKSPREIAIMGTSFVLGFALMPLLQLHSNSLHFGGALTSGYGWWVPEVYAGAQSPFNVAHLFGPTMPRNPIGNVPVYVADLLGVDGMLGQQGDARYFLYPFPVALFAVTGMVATLRKGESLIARRTLIFGISLLGLLFAIYIFDLFTETAYLLPGIFVILVAAGHGAVIANQRMRARWAASRRSTGDLAMAARIAILDLILVFAFLTELGLRLSAEPRESEMVASLPQVASAAGPKATIVSNVSLQFLELYIPGEGRKFIGLNSRDPGETFTDYHLNRLFAKRALGWRGPIPPVLFTDDAMMPTVKSSIVSEVDNPGVFLLLAAPESQEYEGVLNAEVNAMGAAFTLEPLVKNHAIAFFRMKPK